MTLNLASKLFLKMRTGTMKTKCLSQHLLQDNCMVYQVDKGLFTFLPIGQRVVDKLTLLIEKQLIEIGAQKFELPSLASKELWDKTNRWNLMGSELFHLIDRNHQNFCLQPTCEELITKIVKESLKIPRLNSLPLLLFQCNNKYRDEPAPKFGILRSRQFLMNDLYSFDRDEDSAQKTYQLILSVYKNIFYNLLKLKNVYFIDGDSTEMGGRISHEFHMLNNSCEDKIHVCKNCNYSKSIKNFIETEKKCVLSSHLFELKNSIEIAHTFQLGTKYSKVFDAFVASPNIPYFMCCFGIGITRLIAASIDELSVTENAMRLPNLITPYKLGFILPKNGESDLLWNFSWHILNELEKLPNLKGEIFIDDRTEKSIGRRLNDANRLGLPHIIVANTKQTDSPYDPPTFEYFRTFSNTNELQIQKRLTHANLFELANNL